jgi:hypothetical protein
MVMSQVSCLSIFPDCVADFLKSLFSFPALAFHVGEPTNFCPVGVQVTALSAEVMEHLRSVVGSQTLADSFSAARQQVLTQRNQRRATKKLQVRKLTMSLSLSLQPQTPTGLVQLRS